MRADTTFRPEPLIVFLCLNAKCDVYMFIPDDYGPCPSCFGRGILVTKLGFELWKEK